MTATTSKLGADMLTDELKSNPLFEALKLAVGMLSLHGYEDEAKKVVAEARLARQPAAIDKQEARDAFDAWNDSQTALEFDDAEAENHARFIFTAGYNAAPLANEASKPAPSVEQDERAAWRDHPAALDAKALATAQEIALMWGRDRSQFVSRIQVAVRDAMDWVRAASTSANVAQGVEAVAANWKSASQYFRAGWNQGLQEALYACKREHLEEPAATAEVNARIAELEAQIAAVAPAVDAQPVADAWQPIETAPKDGTPLILFARSIKATASIPIFGWFLDEYGWIAQSFHGIEKIVPSHWMPRPEFPAQKDPQ